MREERNKSTSNGKDSLSFEKWIFRSDQPVRDDDHTFFCCSDDFNL